MDLQVFAATYVQRFNDAVEKRDFSDFLDQFTVDAVMRFENVPGAGTLEFAGREAYTAAYGEQGPDDQISIAGPVSATGDEYLIPFAWARDERRGLLRLRVHGERISRLTVTFG